MKCKDCPFSEKVEGKLLCKVHLDVYESSGQGRRFVVVEPEQKCNVGHPPDESIEKIPV